VLKLASSWGVDVVERPISIDEVLEALEKGQLREAFGTGTAAVISPIGELFYKDRGYVINNNQTGELSARLSQELQAIQNGYQADPFNWVVRLA
jgi:branched-chain amino acid aminotransferase